MKIAQALLLRKQLEKKVTQLQPLKDMGDQRMFETKIRRINVTEQVDEVTMAVPKIELKEITKEYDKYATALRKIDAAIQEANWKFDVAFAEKENPFAERTEA